MSIVLTASQEATLLRSKPGLVGVVQTLAAHSEDISNSGLLVSTEEGRRKDPNYNGLQWNWGWRTSKRGHASLCPKQSNE